jgi:hypothetical protein
MGNGIKIPKLREQIRESKGYNSRYFFPGSDEIVNLRVAPKKGKENTEKYRKLKMLKMLKFLDYSYIRAYACKIIMHNVPTPERRERRIVSSTYMFQMRSYL